MKLLEIILVLSISFFLVFSARYNFDLETELIKIETRNELLYSLIYSRSRAILMREKIKLVFVLEENLHEKPDKILKLVKSTEDKTDIIEYNRILPEVEIIGLSSNEEYSPFHFTANGNARNGTLKWEVDGDIESIVINNRGRIRLER